MAALLKSSLTVCPRSESPVPAHTVEKLENPENTILQQNRLICESLVGLWAKRDEVVVKCRWPNLTEHLAKTNSSAL